MSLLFFSNFAFADLHTSNFTPPTHIGVLPTYTTPVVLASSPITTTQACDKGAKSYNAYSPKTQTTSTILIDGVTYPIFPSGFSGIGWILKASGATPYVFKPIVDLNHYNNPNGFYSTTASNQTLYYAYQFSWVQYGTIANGSHSITLNEIMHTYCYSYSNASGDNKGESKLIANTVTLGVTAATCDLTSSDSVTITMPDVNWLTLNKTAVNAEYDNNVFGQTRITLTCDNGILPRYTLKRRVEPSTSTTTQIPLDPSSTASGFALKIKRVTPNNAGTLNVNGGTKYNIVPDGETNQSAAIRTTAGEVRNLDLYAILYKNDDTIVPGPYTALIDLNLIYE